MSNKTIVYLMTLALMSVAGCAQFENMTETQMQKCLGKIDSSAMERLSEQNKAFEAEIEALCKADNRDQAQSKAISYDQQMLADPVVQAMKKCGEDISGLLANIVDGQDENSVEQMEKRSRNVCDNSPQVQQRSRQFTVWP